MAEKAEFSVLIKLNEIQVNLKAPKGQFNNFGKYKYRNCEDILEALKPHLKKQKCILIINEKPGLIDNKFFISAEAILTCIETGNVISASGYAEKEDNKKGMDLSQLTGAASSYAKKYALGNLFALDDSKDADSQQPSQQSEEPKQYQAPQKTTRKALNPTEPMLKRLFAITTASAYTPEEVKVAIRTRYNKESSKDLIREEYDQLCNDIESGNL